MPSNHTNLRIGHLNVRGLECHIDGMKLVLNKNQYHFFGVTETKMKSSSPIGPVRLPSYNFIKHCLPSGRGRGSKSCGGVGLYVQKGIKATPVLKSAFNPDIPIGQRFEFLVVKSRINDLNIGIAIVYNPNVGNQYFAMEYEKLLLDIQDLGFDRVFLLGDYNINVSLPHPVGNHAALNRIHDVFNLSVLPTSPTRITDVSASTIDLLVTDCPQSIITAKAISNCISDHETVFLITDIRVRRQEHHTITVRDFRAVNSVRLQADFQTRNFEAIVEIRDPNVKAERITSELLNLMDRHAPEKVITVKNEKTPWITAEIERAIYFRDLAYALYSRNPNRRRGDNQWCEYVRKRDRAASLISDSKKRYGERYFSSNLPAKKLWNNLRREGIHNSSKNTVPAEQIDPDQLNRFFCDGHRQLQTTAPDGTTAEEHRPGVPSEGRFSFRHTNSGEVARKIVEIQSNAVGADGIPISFLKLLCPFVLPTLVNMYNTIIDTSTFPAIWKKGVVTPIPKISNPTQPKDFRPISVLPAISKVLEKILLGQIVEYTENSVPPLLAENQSGYRKQYSTTTALTKVTHDIFSGFDKGQCTVMVLIDFSLAFNCVKHRQLEHKLREEFHFAPSACDLISSFLTERTQVVKTADTTSAVHPVIDGTPQGSCLSAFLFSIYINSLPQGLQCRYQLYADDLQIYITGPIEDVDRLIAKVNSDLRVIESWARRNALFPNPKKTQSIIFCKEGTVIPSVDIVFCSVAIKVDEKVVNLGLHMDKNLRWTAQVKDVTAKIFGTLHTFRKFAPVLQTATRKKLVQAVLVPFLTYCDVVYYPGLSVALKEQLNRCFKAAVRFVYGMRRRESTAAVRNTVLGHDLETNYQHRIFCFMRQGYTGNQPEYLQQHLQRGQLDRTRNFIIPRHTTSERKSVLVAGAIAWNGLPLAVKQQPTISAFKTALREL